MYKTYAMGKKMVFVGKSDIFGTITRKRFIQFSSHFRPKTICPQTKLTSFLTSGYPINLLCFLISEILLP